VIDAASGAAIADTEVEVSSDDGIRCVAPPCPTNEKTWTGRTDAGGRIDVPPGIVQTITTVRTAAHASASLVDDAELENGGWVLELSPNAVLEASDLGARPFKLIDAKTGNPIANRAVRVLIGDGSSFESRTSPRGYLYLPAEKVLTAIDRVAVVVSGYRRTRLDFAAVRFKTRMQPQ
jgi:hypothetical protein